MTDMETAMLDALKTASGYMLNAKIDLATGTKAKAGLTLEQGLALVRAAIAKAEGRS